MKKPAIFYVPAILLLLAFSGCGAGGRQRTAIPLIDGRYSETLSISLGRYVVPDPRLPAGDSYTDNAYTRFIKERLNVTFTNEFEASGPEYERQLALSVAAGDTPDIMTVLSLDTLNELVSNGLVADLTDVYEAYASPRIKEIYDSYNSRCLDRAMYAGRLMALPGTRLEDKPLMFWIRQDWLDRLGIVLAADGSHRISIEDLEMVARAFISNRVGGEGTLGLAFSPSLWDELVVMEAAFGIGPNHWLRDESGRLYHGSTSSEARRIVEQLRRMFADGILDPQFGTRRWDDITALLINGRLGIVPGQWHIVDWRLSSVRSMDPNAVFRPYTLADSSGRVHVSHNDAAERFVVVRKDFPNPEVLILLANILFDDLKAMDAMQHPEIAAYMTHSVDNSTRPLWMEIEPITGVFEEYIELKELIDGSRALEDISRSYRQMLGISILNFISNPAGGQVSGRGIDSAAGHRLLQDRGPALRRGFRLYQKHAGVRRGRRAALYGPYA